MVDPDHVRERLAYLDLLSPDVETDRAKALTPGIARLEDKARRHVPFEQLDHADRAALQAAWRVLAEFGSDVYFTGVTRFSVVGLSRPDLGRLLVLPVYVHDVDPRHSGTRKLSFEDWITTDPVTEPKSSHPRHAATGSAPESVHGDLVVVGLRPRGGQLILVKGYRRAVRFWTSNDPGTLSTYVPADQ